MTDRITKQRRSSNMSEIRGKNTSLELAVRRALYRKGFRYRIHYNLPGRPDLVFTSKKIAIFVHGCFWHQHNCRKAALPTSNIEFWTKKLKRNHERDLESLQKLTKHGWKTYVLWECEINTEEGFTKKMNELILFIG